VLTATVKRIEDAYVHAAAQVNQLGLAEWESQIVHGDWHPGNMLFRNKRVVAVIDYDAARRQQRVIDFANGALQFSILGGGEDPSDWPEYPDEARFKRFMRGYDSVSVVSVAEIKAVPYLMCEAMIAEAVLPIAATGSFGRFDGFGFLEMIGRKVQWILGHCDQLVGAMED
jgi:homoserine kinase type II